jgi:pyrroloquinoline quinone (PQQ) biosynthesis protein C
VNHPPYGPDDLKAPPLSGEEFLADLQRQRLQKYPELPPFYQALAQGTVKREFLELWVKNLYSYWDDALQFSTGALFVKTNEEDTRTHLLHKLVCIEGKEVVNDLTGWTTPAYEELWLRFGEALGLTRDDVTSWKTFTRSYFAMSTLKLLTRYWEWSWLDGIAALLAGDQLGKECMSVAYDALKTHYGLQESELEFFTVYVEDVTSDIPWEEETLRYWTCTTERQLTAARAFRNRLDIEYQLVLPVHVAATSDRLPLQVP